MLKVPETFLSLRSHIFLLLHRGGNVTTNIQSTSFIRKHTSQRTEPFTPTSPAIYAPYVPPIFCTFYVSIPYKPSLFCAFFLAYVKFPIFPPVDKAMIYTSSFRSLLFSRPRICSYFLRPFGKIDKTCHTRTFFLNYFFTKKNVTVFSRPADHVPDWQSRKFHSKMYKISL